jgi:hypothetical protein
MALRGIVMARLFEQSNAFGARGFLLILTFFGIPGIWAQSSQEHDLKAVFLLNFVRYVEWPASAFPSSNSPVIIAVLGTDPFRGSLDRVVENEKAGERKIVVKHVDRIEEAKPCHLLYVSSSQKNRVREITSTVAGSPVLTASDMDGFVDLGGMICLSTTPAQKVKIIIQLDNVKAAGLLVSSKLLGLAEVRGRGRRVPPGGAWKLSPEMEIVEFELSDKT